jgi:thiamine-phosphate pyrophosphorylase
MSDNPPCQLYLISPQDVGGDFPQALEAALSAGPIAAFQFRVKGVAEDEAARLAAPLQAICLSHDVAFIINDSVALAKRLCADGVHLGQSDGDVRDARLELGPDVQIGVTCHNSRHFAMEAAESGADYVAFGAFFPTATKVAGHLADADIIAKWIMFAEVPCVAIGGITPENAAPLIAAGADFLAVSGGVWNHPDGPAAAVRAFQLLFAYKA